MQSIISLHIPACLNSLFTNTRSETATRPFTLYRCVISLNSIFTCYVLELVTSTLHCVRWLQVPIVYDKVSSCFEPPLYLGDSLSPLQTTITPTAFPSSALSFHPLFAALFPLAAVYV